MSTTTTTPKWMRSLAYLRDKLVAGKQDIIIDSKAALRTFTLLDDRGQFSLNVEEAKHFTTYLHALIKKAEENEEAARKPKLPEGVTRIKDAEGLVWERAVVNGVDMLQSFLQWNPQMLTFDELVKRHGPVRPEIITYGDEISA